eukprot:gnl/MRDRNA2_/MRDRNA2_40467_c0_seq1.p1 gnl/MRDRNA2_/MRDRNA2_40467_c0~~gnl/MRDRNA2_/MRDRNA2_40467_c0_seq1.p1  ORF type:complete len:585 (+),score=119.62 gnl/MRDRNA2_/MRDRNA2_40467_c0_seq1:98-1852(+)
MPLGGTTVITSRQVPRLHHAVGSQDHAGLSSLGDTLAKLSQDQDRSEKLLHMLSSKLKLERNYTQHMTKNFSESGYLIVKEIGQGRFGSIKLAKKKANNYVQFTTRLVPQTKRSSREDQLCSPFVAVRVIPRYRVRNARLVQNEQFSTKETHATLMKQITALRELDHPHISREYETFEDAQCIYIVMELYDGGTLLQRELSGVNPVSEGRCMHLIRQVVSAMAHAHDKNIVHQDLRPENILFASKDDDARVVVTDWQYAEFINAPPRDARQVLPISDFSAPELDVHHRTDRGDIWSIGVIAFALLTYRLPFDDGPITGPIQWDESDNISPQCKEFVASMLQVSAMNRPSAKDLLLNPILSSATDVPVKADQVVDIAKAIVTFSGKSRLQKAAATFAAAHLSGQELHEISQIFNAIDANNDGTIDRAELEAAFDKLDWAEVQSQTDGQIQDLNSKKERMAVVLHALDTDGSGQISYSEFISAAADSHMQSHVELVYEAFRAFDMDGSGFICRSEIEQMLNGPAIDELVEAIKLSGNKEVIDKALGMIGGQDLNTSKELLKKMDKDGNGSISFDEFLHAILPSEDP